MSCDSAAFSALQAETVSGTARHLGRIAAPRRGRRNALGRWSAGPEGNAPGAPL